MTVDVDIHENAASRYFLYKNTDDVKFYTAGDDLFETLKPTLGNQDGKHIVVYNSGVITLIPMTKLTESTPDGRLHDIGKIYDISTYTRPEACIAYRDDTPLYMLPEHVFKKVTKDQLMQIAISPHRPLYYIVSCFSGTVTVDKLPTDLVKISLDEG